VTPLEQSQHLGLPGSKARMLRPLGFLLDCHDLPEDADDVAA